MWQVKGSSNTAGGHLLFRPGFMRSGMPSPSAPRRVDGGLIIAASTSARPAPLPLPLSSKRLSASLRLSNHRVGPAPPARAVAAAAGPSDGGRVKAAREVEADAAAACAGPTAGLGEAEGGPRRRASGVAAVDAERAAEVGVGAMPADDEEEKAGENSTVREASQCCTKARRSCRTVTGGGEGGEEHEGHEAPGHA